MSAPVTDAILFRFTSSGDTLSGLGDGDVIEFNIASTTLKPDDTGRLTIPAFHMARDINIHPNPRRTLDKIQDSLLGIFEVTLNGYFVGHQITEGPRNLFNWQVDEAISPEFLAGRFGLKLASFNSILDLTPLGKTLDPGAEEGYVLHDVNVQDVDKPRDKVPFTVKLYRSGVINAIPVP